MIIQTGSMKIEHANDANIPVVIFLSEPETEGYNWSWDALNFMPRKERLGGSYSIQATSKQEILDLVNRYVTPLYEIAANNLKTTGENYYWSMNK